MSEIIQISLGLLFLYFVVSRFWLLLTLGFYISAGLYVGSTENTWQWLLIYIIALTIGIRIFYLRPEDFDPLSLLEALKAMISVVPWIALFVFWSKHFVENFSTINTVEESIKALICTVIILKLIWHSWKELYKKYPKPLEDIREFSSFPYAEEINTKSSVFWSCSVGGFCLGYALCALFPVVKESIVGLVNFANEVASSHWFSQLG